MNAVRLKTHLDSDTLHITGLAEMAHKDVEVIILADSDAGRPGQAGPAKRKPGSAKGLIEMSDDFQEPLDEGSLREFHR